MSTDAAMQQESEGLELSPPETLDAVRDRFGWKPGVFASLLIKALARLMVPLEDGTYRGRRLEGDPHKSFPVSNTPLTVFVMPEGRPRRLFLAARLRTTGNINIIPDPATDVKPVAFGNQGRRLGSLRMESLVNIQRASSESIEVVPVTRAYHQHHPEGLPTSVFTRLYMFTPMHLWRRAMSFVRTIRTARLRNCRPIDLAEWLERNQQTGPFSQATSLHRELIGRIRSEYRAIAGPPIPQPWEARKAVLSDPILIEFIKDQAALEESKKRKVSREVRKNLREISSKMRVGAFRYAGMALDFGFDRLLTGFEVDAEGIRAVLDCDIRSRVVLVCCHKSYMDPLILTYGICRSGLTAPQQAAGINLNVWPLGYALRRCGAFYLRRSFVEEPVYRESFNAYARRMLADNYLMAFYIEGTRSRDGKMRKPKTGFMKILDEAMLYGACDSISVFPVYLGYDRVPEEGAHVKEMSGGYKVEETVGLFKRLYKQITGTLGRAYVKFGPPVDFRTIVSEFGLTGAADLICERIDAVTVVTARSLASCALLASGSHLVTIEEFSEAAREMLSACGELDLPLAVDANTAGIRAAVDWLAGEGRVDVDTGEPVESFSIVGDQRRFLELNKNISLAHLLGPAMTVVAEASDRETGEALEFLERLFCEEFVMGPGFSQQTRLPAGLTGSRVLASLLDSFLEGYLVASFCVRTVGLDECIGRDDLVERCFAQGEKMLAEGRIRRTESISRVMFENALKGFERLGLLSMVAVDVEGKKKISFARGLDFDQREALEVQISSFLWSDAIKGSGPFVA